MKDDGRDIVLLVAWVVTILILGTSLLFFTKEARTATFIHTANELLAEDGLSYRLETELDSWGKNGRTAVIGQRFSLKDADGFAVMQSLVHEGVPTLCLAFFSDSGQLLDVIPLGTVSERAYERMDPSVCSFYKTRLRAIQKPLTEREKE